MPEEKRKLPEYDNPPVTEVVIGVQFKALEAFTAVHPGLYWQRIRNNYPKFSAKPPLGTTFEFFSGDKLPTFKPKDSQIPPIPRCWLLDDSENRLIQIQSEHSFTIGRKLLVRKIIHVLIISVKTSKLYG